MKIYALPIVAASLLLTTLPTLAGQPVSILTADAELQIADNADFSAKKDEYLQKSKDDMQTWQQKLHDFGEKTKAEGRKAGDATEAALDKAWHDAKLASAKLEKASADGWASAKDNYERATQKLSDTWHKVQTDSN